MNRTRRRFARARRRKRRAGVAFCAELEHRYRESWRPLPIPFAHADLISARELLDAFGIEPSALQVPT